MIERFDKSIAIDANDGNPGGTDPSRPTAAVRLEDNIEFVTDCCRYQEGILTEAAVKKRYCFADDVWEKLGDNEALLEAVEEEKIRRIRNGRQKREKAR